jgi:hypothetical protein
MGFKFSKRGEFFVRNWLTYEAMKDSETSFLDEFEDYLCSLEGILKNKAWWTSRLEFVTDIQASVYISRRDWRDKEGYVIWIGVEYFTPVNVLKGPKRARCFLYVPGNKRQNVKTREDLRKRCEHSGRFKNALELAARLKEYVLVKELRIYSPEELLKVVRNKNPLAEIANFIESVYGIIKPYKIK